ncbi:MAG: RedB protein [Planctomycetota bacterium]|nr:RedB protein [Planctomycetota bacterium]
MPRKQGVGLSRLILASVWGLSVCAGMGILVAYETQPGEAASPPERWPETSGIEKDAERPHLVMLAHPRCPCTRASIGELARIMASCKGRLVAHVLFLKPGEFEKDWAHSDLWRSAASIPGVTAVVDENGMEAQRFGATTSGHAVLYDSDGRLIFSGGITGSRGHFGDNMGRSTVVSLVSNAESRISTEGRVAKCSSYGCPLFDDKTSPQVEE